ncbi:hypothetical protein ACFV0Y_16565 [Streptomyces sp. NPDC059569]|uniref:hypothetical protein n=1 Tax=Streptomyces sp. NPDC059569 TaxID=3346869 RepID=UPI00367F19A3
MDRNHRIARNINMRNQQPPRGRRGNLLPATIRAECDVIDAATNDPAIHAATARIRAALGDDQPTT